MAMEELLEEKEELHIRRDYSFCKSMVYAIQAITDEQTHDILATLVAEGDKLFMMHEIDITKPLNRTGYHGEKKKRSYIYYPNTKLYLGIYVGIRTDDGGYYDVDTYIKGKSNHVSYSFKLPQTRIKMSQKEFDDIAVDGMLTDSSFNFDEPNLRRPSTPAEKKKKEQEYRALQKAKRELKKAQKNL